MIRDFTDIVGLVLLWLVCQTAIQATQIRCLRSLEMMGSVSVNHSLAIQKCKIGTSR